MWVNLNELEDTNFFNEITILVVLFSTFDITFLYCDHTELAYSRYGLTKDLYNIIVFLSMYM